MSWPLATLQIRLTI